MDPIYRIVFLVLGLVAALVWFHFSSRSKRKHTKIPPAVARDFWSGSTAPTQTRSRSGHR